MTTPSTPPPTAPPSPTGPLVRALTHPQAEVARAVHAVSPAVPALLAGGSVAAVGTGIAVGVGMRRRRSLGRGGRLITIASPPEPDAGGAAVLWTNLHDLLRPRLARLIGGQPHLAFELGWSTAGITVAIWVPDPIPPGLVERAVSAAWPGAITTTTPARPALLGNARAIGGELRFAGPDWFPLNTDHPADPYRALLGAAAELTDTQTAVMQILARPATSARQTAARRAARNLTAGTPPTATGRLLDLVTPTSSRPVGARRPPADPGRAGEVRDILTKAAQLGWEIRVRYAITDTSTTENAAATLRGRAHAMASAFAVWAGRARLARRPLRRPAAAINGRRLSRGDAVSVAELASLAHLPTDLVLPGLNRAGARPVAPSPVIARAGIVLGDSEIGQPRPVALHPDDTRFHTHLIGATGAGKSTLLTNLVLADAAAGRGAVVIDPKGDLIADITDRLPRSVIGRTVIIDPSDRDAPPTLNVLDGPDPDLAVDHLVGIFRRIFDAFWGPRTDDILRSACLTLLRHPPASLADVPRLLADPVFRAPYLVGVDDPVGLGGFWAWYTGLGDAAQAQVIGPVMNKLRAFLLRPFVRDLIGAGTSSFDLADVLDGGLCLVRAPKGTLGDDTARLLGSFVVAKTWQAATARATQSSAARVTASLYVDECHNFLTLPRSFDEMLAEARGYGLSLVLAHQHLGQLPRDLRDAISTNARTKIVFAVGPEDARVLERHTLPELGAHDLAHLDAYQACARVVTGGAEQPACTIRTRPAPPPIGGRAEQVRGSARARYGRTGTERAVDQARRHLGAHHTNAVQQHNSPGAGSRVGTSPGTLRTAVPTTPESAGQAPGSPAAAHPDFQDDC